MSTPDQNQAPAANGEQLFVRQALASVERAARFSRIKQIVVIVIAFPALYYLMGSAPEHAVPFTVIMVIGVLLVGITSKIMAKLDSHTRTILRAIAELPQK
jgi:hypothetical protein